MKKRPVKSKRVQKADTEDILPEYDFSKAHRNPYADRRREGSNVVLLDPDVAKDFPDSQSVNEALRALSSIIRRRRSKRRRPGPPTG
ncbi:MAG: hypothetical protein M3O61_10875 [Gemmatimonadota bacterium]|nr:hypothetical protein [Gemmatimonadota bacterium]